ncbi:MAG: hypothetical protein ISS82_03835 [Nanoarchaeota archaeon]|nr:hypothetical protein [Nanoarchaeota archaeon]
MEFSDNQLKEYMQRCIDLAKQATDNGVKKPFIGALVISGKGEIVGEGYRSFIPHTKIICNAERIALEGAGDLAKGGTLITTLEPFNIKEDYTLSSSCTQLIVKKCIETIVIGSFDTFKENDEGIKYLTDSGVKIVRYTNLKDVIREELV